VAREQLKREQHVGREQGRRAAGVTSELISFTCAIARRIGVLQHESGKASSIFADITTARASITGIHPPAPFTDLQTASTEYYKCIIIAFISLFRT
jgi:hypothetical protein